MGYSYLKRSQRYREEYRLQKDSKEVQVSRTGDPSTTEYGSFTEPGLGFLVDGLTRGLDKTGAIAGNVLFRVVKDAERRNLVDAMVGAMVDGLPCNHDGKER